MEILGLAMDGETLRQYLIFLAPYIICALIFLILTEQLSYLKKKGPLTGPSLIVPLLGSAIPMILNPTRFWEVQAQRAESSGLGFSADFLVGRFILFIRSTELSHKIFANVRPDAFHLIGHPFGKKLFGEHNMIYMFDQAHKDLRRRIAPNFTPKALSTYMLIQQRVILSHLQKWLDQSKESNKPMSIRIPCRDMNLETSQTVFVGPYLLQETRDRFNKDYNLFNVGLMALPVDLPGFAFRKARLAVSRLVDALSECVKESKTKMMSSEEPTCLVDFWMHDIVRDSAEAKISDKEVGGHLFDFLFAAQDASTSSLCWAVSLLDSHPDVLDKVRAEVSAIWSPDSDEPISAEMISQMRYTASVAREVVRIRPPATMVPHIAGEPFQLTEWYTIPKGTIVFPSVYESSFQGFPEPDRFDPDRFSKERQEDQVYKRNFLAFGAGAHQCVGQRYAINHLVLFIALFVSLINFKRDITDGCDEIMYVPTIVPKDDCRVYMSQRCAKLPRF
ncbi:hypothetical protein LUZ60_007440 [Juncus effusus]|nr:hypothetical protein LUZ60_007440 [Juncus effusus]